MSKSKIITSIGGQALIEGVMMRGPKKTFLSVRLQDNSLYSEEIKVDLIQKKYKIFKYPFFRGIAGLVDSLRIGQKALNISAEKSTGLDKMEPESKFEKWISKTFGDKITNVIIFISTVLGICLSLFLFFFLPSWIFNVTVGNMPQFAGNSTFRSIFEGIIKFLIFLAYMFLCSQIKDIKRVFQYHGAEHKTIFCYENQDDLTIENVKKCSRFHPRCGTSFIVVMLLIGIVIGIFIPFHGSALRAIIKILLIPVMASLGYELIKFCGRHDNKLTRIIASPGLWMQRITTKEPDDSMIEVAINSLKAVIPENKEDQIKI